MTPERWLEVERLYHAALAQRADARVAFLRDACGGDETLRREVDSLLAHENEAAAFLSTTVDAMAASVLGENTSFIGRQLGPYTVRAQIGAGGMGEVYLARHAKLERDVAIKILPRIFTKDPDRVARFEREARVLASLNHPNIAAIYGLEECDGAQALIMEFVEGETLDERIKTAAARSSPTSAPPAEAGTHEGRGLPIREALGIARQIADALDVAHERGVVHRDLKPANIKITPQGTVKVLDFGLAIAGDRTVPDVSLQPTLDLTREGVILGTVTYMSPEQARGQVVNSRTDIWAFGCVLYEALAGRKAFQGETTADCLTAILEREPDWTALPSPTPARVVGLLRRCFEKDAQRRLPEIADARRELEDILASGSGHAIVAPPEPAMKRNVPKALYVGSVLGILIAGVVGFRVVRQITLRPERVDIGLAVGEFIPPTHSSELALSPDGTLIAYASMKATEDVPMMAATQGHAGDEGLPMQPMSMMMTPQIYVRSVDQGDAKPIGGALGDAPFFSPDGKSLGFWHAPTATLRRVALTGGAPVKICNAVSGISGAAWGPDDSIVFAWFDLFRVPAAGGSPKLLLKVDQQRGESFYRHPSFLPSGKAILFTIGRAGSDSYDDAEIGVLSLETGEKKIIVEGGSSARYSPSGHVIYARGGKLLAVPFDSQKLQVTGLPFPVADGIFMSSNTGMAAYSISADGRLVYAAGPVEGGGRLPVWVDRHGQSTPLSLPPRSYLHPRLSPDGRQLALEVEGASHDIFTYDFARGALTKMSFDGASHWPSWTPTGDRLTFRSWKTGTMTMWWMPVDRSGPPELLTNIGSMQSPESWSPDGKALAFTQMDDPESGSDIYVLTLAGDHKPQPLIRTKFSEGSPKFSPDGKWLAYSSNESGRPEVYATAYGPGPKIQISTDGGTDPVWRRDGRELYYRNGDLMMAVDVTRGRTLTVSKPQVLWEGHYLAGAGSSCGMAGPTSANYDVASGGERFLMIEDMSPNVECKLLHVVSNWSRDLKSQTR